jgi:DNA adenine methylase
VQRAARFFYLQQLSFGGKVSGQTFGTATTAPAINLLRIEETLSAAHLRLAGGTYIEQLDWSACIDRYDRPHTLFYADPPYFETEGYGVPFTWEQYELMATKLKNLKGKAVVSINDHPAIRECFKDFEMEELKLDYIVGGGANRVERGELIIYSWNRACEPAGLF